MDRREYLLNHITQANPQAAPERTAWRVPVWIADVRLDLISQSAALAERAKVYFKDYLATNSVALPALSAAEVIINPLPQSLELPDLWEDEDPEYQVVGDRVVQRDFVARRLPDQEGRIRAIAWVAPELDDAIHNLLRWFLPPILLRSGSFLMHGAGLIRDQKGYAFFGQSGAGKSTTSSLIAESDPKAVILGDDSIILQMRKIGPSLFQSWLHSAPLGCGYSRLAPPRLSAPLLGLYALEQNRQNSTVDLTPSQAAAGLLASAMNVSPSDDIEERFDLATQFASLAPGIQKLQFTKDAGFWKMLLGERHFDGEIRGLDSGRGR